jgi:NADPH:quinone reductase-like Zn-dependent oxidoreductase
MPLCYTPLMSHPASQFSEPIAEENEVIVRVRAAALKPIDKQMASGSHYAAFRELPVECGMDGVGCLDDGTRVFFVRPRPPYGSMAQRTIVSPSHSFPIPDNVDDDIAAAIVNPGLSTWGALAWRAQLTVVRPC